MYVCALPFFSWKEHAMNKVMKAEVDQNVILNKVLGETKIDWVPKTKLLD